LQSVLERVELGLFQGLILEMKRLAKISLLPVKQPRQVEIERLYEQNRVLLRFRFMPTQNGEEATLQVLRGAALKFYQQQQLSNLEHDALRMARQLQNKLSEIRDRARKESGLADARLEALPALAHLLRRMEAQLEELQDDEEIEE
jgi:type II secretory ATPase GspE/PulE/Tfp pilus assembly ATPase PilB-like protein